MLGRLLGTGEELPVGRLALATFVFAAFVTLVLTLERRRWLWSAAAAVGVGALLALIGWTTAQYNGSSWSFGWPFASRWSPRSSSCRCSRLSATWARSACRPSGSMPMSGPTS